MHALQPTPASPGHLLAPAAAAAAALSQVNHSQHCHMLCGTHADARVEQENQTSEKGPGVGQSVGLQSERAPS